MKVSLFTIVCLLLANPGNGQSLQRDNLFGVHLIDVQLNPAVTMEAFEAFFVQRVIPEYEKHWIGLKGHLVKSVRGEHQNKFAIVWVFATEPTRDYYFNPDGSMHQREREALQKVEPIEAELKAKYGSYTITYMDDWVVQ